MVVFVKQVYGLYLVPCCYRECSWFSFAFPEKVRGKLREFVSLASDMPAPYWAGDSWQAAPNMSSTYGTNNPVAYEGRVHYASLPNCLCISEDCCFEEGQPAGYCGQKHLFQSEEALVTCISNYINQRVAANNQDASLEKLSTIFHAVRPPSISVLDYLLRMFKYAFCSRSCFVTAIVYLERLAAKERVYLLTSLNVHRLLITSLMLAAKYLDDIYYNNAYYAKVGGVSLGEMNLLELELLEALSFSLAVDKKEYFLVENMLIAEAWACNSASHVLAANNFAPLVVSSPVHRSLPNNNNNNSNQTVGQDYYSTTTDVKYKFPGEYLWRPVAANPVEYNLVFHGRHYISQKPPPGFERVYSHFYSGNIGYPNGVSPVTPECVQVGPPHMFHRPSMRRF